MYSHCRVPHFRHNAAQHLSTTAGISAFGTGCDGAGCGEGIGAAGCAAGAADCAGGAGAAGVQRGTAKSEDFW